MPGGTIILLFQGGAPPPLVPHGLNIAVQTAHFIVPVSPTASLLRPVTQTARYLQPVSPVASLDRAWVGIGPPNVLWVPIVSRPTLTDAGPIPAADLSAATSVTFLAYRPDQPTTPVTWAGDIHGATPPDARGESTMLATHALQSADCPVPGRYQIVLLVTFSDGVSDSTPASMIVSPRSG